MAPKICGENTNQHSEYRKFSSDNGDKNIKIFQFLVYVNFDGLNPITISIDTNSNYVFNRRWNIRIQQVACDSVEKGEQNIIENDLFFFSNRFYFSGPNGCLQYYDSVSQTVASFNYATSTNSRGIFSFCIDIEVYIMLIIRLFF